MEKGTGIKVTLLRNKNVIAINNMTIVLEVKNSYQTHDKVSLISNLLATIFLVFPAPSQI